jgi:hypothetical protein
VSPISESEAVRIAQQACADQHIRWEEPHRTTKGLRSWRILTPSDRRGGNTMIIVSRKSGMVRLHRYGK